MKNLGNSKILGQPSHHGQNLCLMKRVKCNKSGVRFAPDAPLSSLLDPLEGLSVLNYERLELEGRTRLPTLKRVRGAC
jgi:hypothetical protein